VNSIGASGARSRRVASDARFWLVNVGLETIEDPRQPPVYPLTPGVKALYMVCVHLGCLYKWVPTQDRFECPCHGSKYLTSGVRVDGPARRNLDVFIVTAFDASGNKISETKAVANSVDGAAIDITGAVKIVVDTGKPRVNGDFNSAPGGGK